MEPDAPGPGGRRGAGAAGADRTGDLRERVAIVTGASSGIGAAVARSLAREGARVALAARRRDRLEELVAEIEEAGGTALALPTDVSDRTAVEALAARTREAWGRIDILVNNAGVMPLSRLEEGRVEDWERMVDVNLKGVLYGIAAVLPTMIDAGGGHVVNVGSVAGRRPFPGGTVYAATKFALRALTWGMHLELSASRGIRVTDIQPGVVDTELPDGIPGDEARAGFRERWEGKRPLRPDDVAAAVLFAVTAPEHVNVNELLVRPTDQET